MMLEVGDTVRIKSGAYAAFAGKVEEVWPDSMTLSVSVTGLWREVTIRLPFEAVEKVTFTGGQSDDASAE